MQDICPVWFQLHWNRQGPTWQQGRISSGNDLVTESQPVNAGCMGCRMHGSTRETLEICDEKFVVDEFYSGFGFVMMSFIVTHVCSLQYNAKVYAWNRAMDGYGKHEYLSHVGKPFHNTSM